MSRKEFQKVCSRVSEDLHWLQHELYKKSNRIGYKKMLDFLYDCKKGHACYCSAKTKRACKQFKEIRGCDLNSLKNNLWKLNHTFENLPLYLKQVRKEKKKGGKLK